MHLIVVVWQHYRLFGNYENIFFVKCNKNSKAKYSKKKHVIRMKTETLNGLAERRPQ